MEVAAQSVRGIATHLARIVGMLLIVGGVTFARGVASGSEPILIAECRVLNNHGDVAPFGAVSLTFANRSSVVASQIRFRIVYAGQTVDVVDSGTFAANVVIHHSFGAYRNVVYRGPTPEKCAATAVEFVDGTVWQSQSP